MGGEGKKKVKENNKLSWLCGGQGTAPRSLRGIRTSGGSLDRPFLRHQPPSNPRPSFRLSPAHATPGRPCSLTHRQSRGNLRLQSPPVQPGNRKRMLIGSERGRSRAQHAGRPRPGASSGPRMPTCVPGPSASSGARTLTCALRPQAVGAQIGWRRREQFETWRLRLASGPGGGSPGKVRSAR